MLLETIFLSVVITVIFSPPIPRDNINPGYYDLYLLSLGETKAMCRLVSYILEQMATTGHHIILKALRAATSGRYTQNQYVQQNTFGLCLHCVDANTALYYWCQSSVLRQTITPAPIIKSRWDLERSH